jgi:hypothetical protein
MLAAFGSVASYNDPEQEAIGRITVKAVVSAESTRRKYQDGWCETWEIRLCMLA